MTIYTDGTHVISDSGLNDLHGWAKQAGVKPSHYQAHPRHPHYDLPKYMRGQRLVNAATVTSRDLVRVLHGQKFGATEFAGGGAVVTAPKHLRGCGFCGEPFTAGRPNAGYLYPVAPGPGEEFDGADGRQACSVCLPAQTKRSVDANLLVLYSVPAAPAQAKGDARE